MRTLIKLALCLAVITVSATEERIIGGSLASIERYPFAATLLVSPSSFGTYKQACGGSIINNRAILTAAHCFNLYPLVSQWRVRVGTVNANSGGVVFGTSAIVRHPNFNARTFENDISILRIKSAFSFNNNVRAAAIAGSNYNVANNQVVQAIGWGLTRPGGVPSEVLNFITIWTINQNTCRTRYAELGLSITDNMLCAGWLNVSLRDQCDGDSGSPVLYLGTIIGVCSWRHTCANRRYPSVNTRVSRYTAWIQNNS